MAPDELVTITITGTVPCVVTDTVRRNVVDVATTVEELSLANKTFQSVNWADQCPIDFEIVKVDLQDPVSAGDVLTYEVRINNSGTGGTTAYAKDKLPAAVDFKSVSTTKGTCSYHANDHDVNCSLWLLLPGDHVIVTIAVTVGVTCFLLNIAEVGVETGQSEEDSQPGDNIDTEGTRVSGIDCIDLGDAPDSSNHYAGNMTTYGGSARAMFDTVYDPDTGLPPGPKHRYALADVLLGEDASDENEAGPGRRRRW